jgi:hypothetical protein
VTEAITSPVHAGLVEAQTFVTLTTTERSPDGCKLLLMARVGRGRLFT